MTLAETASLTGVEHLNSADFARTGLPFSEIVRVGSMLYLSGQMGTKPGTLALVDGGMAAEARQALQNVQRALEAHGYSLQHVVKCTVMLGDMRQWAAFNTVYASYFKPGRMPARSSFGASGLAFGAGVEVECLAYQPAASGAEQRP